MATRQHLFIASVVATRHHPKSVWLLVEPPARESFVDTWRTDGVHGYHNFTQQGEEGVHAVDVSIYYVLDDLDHILDIPAEAWLEIAAQYGSDCAWALVQMYAWVKGQREERETQEAFEGATV